MADFQSYLIVGPNQKLQREETEKIAARLKIDLKKVSPDIYLIEPTKQEISIDQIRQLKGHIFQKPVQYSHKFVVITDAHKTTLEAQNALLKILEEPPKHAILVLEAKNKALLLPTIISRTVTVQRLATIKADSNTLISQDLESALETISQVENPEEFLDEQIIALTSLLTSEHKQNLNQIIKAIESCAETKEMITANVNATFALTSLVFSLNLPSSLN